MSQYEALYILPGTITEAETEPLLAKMKDIISGSGAADVTVFPQGKHRLAYPIRHIRYGYVFVVHFSADKKDIPSMQERLRLLSEPLRVMITLRDAHISGDPVVRYMREEQVEKAPVAAEIALEQVPVSIKEEKEKEEPVAVSAEDIDKQLDKILSADLGNV